MTAPLDIGLEQSDANLGLGQDDIFDLQDAEKKIRKGRSISGLLGQAADEPQKEVGLREPNIQENDVDNDDDTRVTGLEAELDDLYDAYKERLTERDAKAKAREARKVKEREEWHGFGGNEGDPETEDDGESTEGEKGWHAMERAKFESDETSSSNDDSDSEEARGPASTTKKRKLGVISEPSSKKTKLVSNLNGASSRSAQIWFDQDIFKGVDLDDIDDDKEANETGSNEGEEAVDEANITEVSSPSSQRMVRPQ